MSLEKVSDSVKSLAEQLEGKITIDGNLATIDKEVYEQTLPEGLDLLTVKRVQNHNLDVADAVTLAFGKKAIRHMEDNADVASVGLTVNVGLDRISSEVHRHKQYRNPQEEGKFIDKYGVADTKYVSGINGKRSSYKEVQHHLGEIAESIFKR